jgi:hypothetical protein
VVPILNEVTVTILALALPAVAGILAAGGTTRRALAIGVSTSVILVPWMAETRLVQALLALYSLVSLGRVIDLVRMQTSYAWRRRVVHALSSFDSRKATQAPPKIPRLAVMSLLLYAPLMLLGLYVVLRVAPNMGGKKLQFLLRSAGGLLFFYCLSETLYAAVWGGLSAIGFVFPPLHVSPILSRSVQEFWGERWNRTVNDWLRTNCFMPLARRRRPVLGVAAAFVSSAALHAYMTVVPLGLAMAGWMTAYFLVQPLLIGMERMLGVARWSVPAAHLWTVTVMVLPSPLFVEPMLQILRL